MDCGYRNAYDIVIDAMEELDRTGMTPSLPGFLTLNWSSTVGCEDGASAADSVGRFLSGILQQVDSPPKKKS